MPFPKAVVSVTYVKSKSWKISPTILDSISAANIIRTLFDKDRLLWVEEIIIIALDSSNRLRCWAPLALGGMDNVEADIRVLTTIAAVTAASNVIIAHNHPSGSSEPSKADIDFTNRAKYGLLATGRNLIDHIIITEKGHLSLKDCGYLD